MCSQCKKSVETIAAQAGNHRDAFGSVSAPLYFSSNYRHPSLDQAINFDESKEYTYVRLATPTRRVLEETLAELEAGQQAFALSSGMDAVQLALSILKIGDELIFLDDLYGGDFRYFRYLESHMGVSFKQWDGEKLEDLVQLLSPKTRVVWVETPSNPTMKKLDLEALSKAVHDYNPAILVMVDNTFYTPIYQQPLTLGADVVVHSATKYLSGHNDLLGGVMVVKDQQLGQEYYEYYITTGDTMATFDAWLLLRSLKTLPIRMERHTQSALKIKAFLESRPEVTKVLYPGKAGMISFYLATPELTRQVLDNVKLISFAESLGGAESLITVPLYQTHADVEEAQREKLGITPTLLRLSVGLEDPDDLIADLAQTIDKN